MSRPLPTQALRAADLEHWRALAEGAPDGAPVSLSLAIERPPGGLLDYLPADLPYWYFADPARGTASLGIGSALHLDSRGSERFDVLGAAFTDWQTHWRSDGPATACLGFAFGDSADDWPAARLTLPAVYLELDRHACRLTLNASAGSLRREGACLPAWRCAATAPLPACQRLDDPLEPARWLSRVHTARREIAAGRLEKLVLCREARLEAASPPDAATILAALHAQPGGGQIFAHGQGQRHFVGSTPERLLSRRGISIEADALAGTAWRDAGELDAAKNRHEQALVSTAIADALAPFCTAPPRIDGAQHRPAGPVIHLHSTVRGELRNVDSLFPLLAALHPTPAVGGQPRVAALAWLQAHDEQRAAWYTGGIGQLSANGDGELLVALRCALIDGRSIRLQAGAGIVAASEPLQELAETEAKLSLLLTLFGCHDAVTNTQQNDGLEAYT